LQRTIAGTVGAPPGKKLVEETRVTAGAGLIEARAADGAGLIALPHKTRAASAPLPETARSTTTACPCLANVGLKGGVYV
jgi:hypothetical protein